MLKNLKAPSRGDIIYYVRTFCKNVFMYQIN